jgi:hypothetical protein
MRRLRWVDARIASPMLDVAVESMSGAFLTGRVGYLIPLG